MSHALRGGADSLRPLLDEFPELVNDVSTGGATPLHMCGMSQSGQKSTTFLIERGGEIEAIDTYGYRPIHRMASNNLAQGADALCKAGADVYARTTRGETALSIARASGAGDVIAVLQGYMRT
jgi:ankyrin repeat protein